MNKRLHTIKEVSLRTGLSTQLIRKWEERYGVVSPSRFPNGYRGYTKEHVETFLWLKGRVDAGVPIGLAVQELQAGGLPGPFAEAEWFGAPASPNAAAIPSAEEYQRQFLTFFLRLDYRGSQQLFDHLTALHRLDFVLARVLQPALVELGEMWLRGEASEYQEHFGSHFVRDRLLAMKNLFVAAPSQPLFVTACSPYERHEIGVLLFGFYALQQGFQIVYLGTSPSEKGIMDCLRQATPRAFAFGVSTMDAYRNTVPFLRRLDDAIAAQGTRTKVFVGGRVIGEDAVLQGTRAVHLLAGDAKASLPKIKAILSV